MIDTTDDGDLAQARHAVRRLEQVNREIHGRVEELRGQVQALAEALGRERTRRVEAEAVLALAAEALEQWDWPEKSIQTTALDAIRAWLRQGETT